jgi:serine/threonine-protein kinase
VVGNRYELQSLVATGGMGQVWRARDTLLNRAVAVKLLRSEFTGDATFVARFRAEAQHAAVLANRNIATVYDYGEVTAGPAGGEPLAFLVMELVEGESLSDLLARDRRPGVDRTLEILRQTAAALAAAHAAGVVHRDVKPGNVLVGRDGIVKITDFGIAWSASSVPLTQTGQVVGTAHYLAPEQAAGGKAGPASDVYSLGMIGYECLAGRRAFDGDNAVQIALMHLRDVPDPLPADVPENVRRLIGRALAKDPADRFTDGAAFHDAVNDVLAGRMLTPPPVGSGTLAFPVPGGGSGAADDRATGRWRRRVLVPALVLALAAGAGVAGLRLSADSTPPPVSAAEPAPLVLKAEDYVGRPVADVEADLGSLGLAVDRIAEETGALAPGLVTRISPAGAVSRGDRIAVSYAVAPPPPPVVAPAPVPVPAPVAVSGGTTSNSGQGSGTAGAGNHGSGNQRAGDQAPAKGKPGKAQPGKDKKPK